MASFLDVCRFTPTLGGTTDWIYSSAITGYQGPAAAGAVNGAIYRYRAESADLSQWEVGYGAYTSGTTTFARTTVLFNSSGTTAKISFSTVPQVAIVALAEDLANVNSNGGFVNKFRNGTMDVWQRGTVSITVTTAGAYTADGWIVTPTGASCTAIQASNNRTGANTLFGLQLTGATSVTDITLTQRIESYIAAPLAGSTVTVQAQIFNNTGASITPTLTTKSAGTTDVWTSPVADLAATNLQACANGVWTQVAYTFSVAAAATKGYEFIFDFGNNFSTTGKSVTVAELDVRVTSGLGMGLNSNPALPELRLVPTETQFCQRYFRWTSGATNTEPSLYGNSSGGNFAVTIIHPVPMMKTPTAAITGTFGFVNASAFQAIIGDQFGYLAFATASGAGNVSFQPNGSARIAFSAEL